MLSLNQITTWVRDIRSFQGLLEVYEDLAAQKMQKVRGEIAKYREFTQSLSVMSRELEMDVSMVVTKNERQKAVVLISSDKGLYGRAFEPLGRAFLESVNNNMADVYVVGSIGKEMMALADREVKYKTVEANDEALADLWRQLSEYQEINIHYLKYDSLAKQTADVVHISGDVLPKEGERFEYHKEAKLRYLYEPTVAQVAELFAKEILSYLSQQTMKEADLAKYAARLMYLDSCVERNNRNLVGVMRQKTVLSKRLSNKRQNSRMVGFLIRNSNGQ